MKTPSHARKKAATPRVVAEEEKAKGERGHREQRGQVGEARAEARGHGARVQRGCRHGQGHHGDAVPQELHGCG